MRTYARRTTRRPQGDRRSGCVGFLLLPFVLAARVCRPTRPDRLIDAPIESAKVARTVIGFAATAWLIYAYPLRESAGSIVEDKLVELFLSAGLLLVVGPVALAAFVFSARRPGPAFYRARLRGPLTALGTVFGTALLLVLVGPLTDAMSRLFSLGIAGYLLYLALSFAFLFAVPFGLAAAAFCVHHCFRTADVHEVLPPLISPVLVWAMALFQLFDAPPVNAPLGVRLLFVAGPPLSVTALSVWELRRLRVQYGITVRAALGR
ncbi:hypothetical protein ABZZ17_11020 [Streptomyces sp. NPDC006512]|uniref:hypothetical protein n=1 Tax=Streptomyces sp. NPDC006512 TaxID=3154307 RepID=UPI0033A6779E